MARRRRPDRSHPTKVLFLYPELRAIVTGQQSAKSPLLRLWRTLIEFRSLNKLHNVVNRSERVSSECGRSSN